MRIEWVDPHERHHFTALLHFNEEEKKEIDALPSAAEVNAQIVKENQHTWWDPDDYR